MNGIDKWTIYRVVGSIMFAIALYADNLPAAAMFAFAVVLVPLFCQEVE